ncbi:unnamed protein product [Paramecium octaurelia]|uniref:Uncharacterized protein n=1 Tax=Paramecium octaurelia TaxID=43137 RepID=A0A8S1TH95_PAROT|nr:unnamed protein product [Paramecium octaurelia]
MVCEIHKLEIIALDLDTSEKDSFNTCAKINNIKISTIEQAIDRISSLKTQKKRKQDKKIEMIMDFKNTVLKIFQKKFKVKQQPKFIRYKEKNNLYLKAFKSSRIFKMMPNHYLNFFHQSSKTNKFNFNEIANLLMEFLNNLNSYLITLHIFKLSTHSRMLNRRSIKQANMFKVNQWPKKIKIIIKKLDDRFACVDCISDYPHCQYRTIEKVNQEWNSSKQQQDRNLNDLKLMRQDKQEKLNQLIALIRKIITNNLMKSVNRQLHNFQQPKQLIFVNSSKSLSKDQVMKNQFQILVIQFGTKKKSNPRIQKLNTKNQRIYCFQKRLKTNWSTQNNIINQNSKRHQIFYKKIMKFKGLIYNINKFQSLLKEVMNNQFKTRIRRALKFFQINLLLTEFIQSNNSKILISPIKKQQQQNEINSWFYKSYILSKIFQNYTDKFQNDFNNQKNFVILKQLTRFGQNTINQNKRVRR